MNFKNQYLTYKEYCDLGGSLDETNFNLLEYDAQKTIDERTLNRLTELQYLPNEVKFCIFRMLNIEKSYQVFEDKDKTIASESIDGYSVSYRQADKSIIEAKNDELEREIKKYLSSVVVNGTPILYRGADV